MALAFVILAAGFSKRMKTKRSKVLHPLAGRPLIRYISDLAASFGPDRLVFVVSEGGEGMPGTPEGSLFAVQKEPLGTGHAALAAEASLGGFAGTVCVINGDSPLLTRETLDRLLETHEAGGAAATVLTSELADPTGYGRILRRDGSVARVVEETDATDEERGIREVNTGFYCFDKGALFTALHSVESANAQGEYYLTDVIEILLSKGMKVDAAQGADPDEILGVNSRRELAVAERVLKERQIERLFEAGATVVDPASTFVGPEVEVGRDTIVHPFTFLEGATVIGEDCVIGPSTRLVDCTVADGAEVAFTVAKGAEIGPEATVGPYAHLRPGTKVGRGAKVGGFVEVKKSEIGEGSKVPHLSYIGDAVIGKDVNVGAGTITCNYNGFEKHETVIEDEAFIGSDTMLIAPVRIGKGAVTGAGSAISEDVPADALGLERAEQENVEGWAKERRERHKSGGSE